MHEADANERRLGIVSANPFDETVERLTVKLGRPDPERFRRALERARTDDNLRKVVESAVGSSHLIELVRLDACGVLRKGEVGQGPNILRVLVSNPVIMKEMAKTVPAAVAYAPITILIDEGEDGVHLTCDSVAALVAPYGSPSALAIATDIDMKTMSLLEHAAKAPGDERALDCPRDPISEAGSLAAVDAILMGGLLNDW